MNLFKEMEHDIQHWLALATLFLCGAVAGFLVAVVIVSGVRMVQ